MKRNITLDILKLTLAFMIVGIHTKFLSNFSDTWAYLTTNGIFRIAIPIFLIINGFYFYNLRTIDEIFSWLKRITILYMFWMIFYAYFWLKGAETTPLEITKIILTIFNGYYHLWYLPGIIGSAILLQMLNQRKLNILIPIIFFFTIGVTIQYVGNYHLVTNPNIDTLFNYDWSHRNYLFLAFPFFSIGFLLNKHSIAKKTSLTSIITFTILGTTLLILESYMNYHQHARSGGFDNLAALLIVCPAIFLLFMKVRIYGKSKQLTMFSAGVYFIHPFLISFYMKFLKLEPTELTVVVFLSSILSCYILIQLNKKLKFIL